MAAAAIPLLLSVPGAYVSHSACACQARAGRLRMTAADWLQDGLDVELPTLPLGVGEAILLPGQTGLIRCGASDAARASDALEAAWSSYSCVGMPLMPTGDGSTLVTVLELLDAPCDARGVRVKCVGRALAPAGCRPMGGSSRMVPFTDSTLELYDIMACADYDAVCESLHASCCRLQAKLHRAVGSGERRAAMAAGGVDATLQPSHPLFIESLPTIIARQCAALDYREAALGQDAALGPRMHPGLAHPGFLAAAVRQPQGTELAPLDALWSADVAAAETQMRSFATACYLAPRDRLHALQTRSTLERCVVSVAALTRHERVLVARLALAQALGGREDDAEA